MARKVLEAKGVAHFWDQVLSHVRSSGDGTLHLKLGSSTANEDMMYKKKTFSDDQDVKMEDRL